MSQALSPSLFSSPAKRRKLGFATVDAAGGACSETEAGGSRQKASVTITPQKSRMHEDSSTPGNRAQAGMDDGLLSISPELLPAQLMLLNQLLGALYVTIPLVKSRGKRTTYQNLQVPVQNFTGRDFQIRHVQQIKALCPGALDWEYMLTTNAATSKQEQQLLIKLPTNSRTPKQSFDTAQMQQTFFKGLQQYAQIHQVSFGELQLPMADLPPLAGPNARDCTPSRRGINPYELLPGTPQTAPPPGALGRTHSNKAAQQSPLMSPPPKRAAATSFKGAAGLMSPPPARTRGARVRQLGKGDVDSSFSFSPAPKMPALNTSKLVSPAGAFSSHHTPVKSADEESTVGARTPALRPNKLFGTPLAAATPQQAATSRPTERHSTPVEVAETSSQAAPGGLKVRRLTFDTSTPAMVTTDSKKKTSSGLTFELGDSAMMLLQKVSDAEVHKENNAQQQELDQQRALDMLPGTFEVMRAVFGDKGACVKPKSEVLQLLRQKSTCKSGMSSVQARQQLELMLRFIPEFVRTINPTCQSLAGMAQSVRINRQMSWPGARQKLLAAAAEARSAGVSAAAQAISADEVRGRIELKAAAPCGSDEGESECGNVIEAANYDAPDGHASMRAQPDDDCPTSSMAVAKSGSSSGSDGLSDEAIMLLGGTIGNSANKTSRHGAKGMNASMLSCLSFKAPAGTPCR